MSWEYGFLFAKEKCIQCHGCETACKSWRNVEHGIWLRRVDNIWEGQYPTIKSFSASISCMHCLHPACIGVCPNEAIAKREEDGIVWIDKDKCDGCRICIEACPFGVPQFGEDGKMQKCDMCVDVIDIEKEPPPCTATCPTQALMFSIIDREEKASTEQLLQELIKI